ncbi:unnamed protein product [Sympodiomycopsis kandeliae]
MTIAVGNRLASYYSYDDSISVPLSDLGATHEPFPSSIQNGIASGNPQALRDVESFIQDLFIFRWEAWFYVTFSVAAILLLLLVVVGGSIILFRICKGKFWVVRFMRRSEGVYIVPNALNAFALFEGLFGILWFTYACIIVGATHYHRGFLQHHLDALNLIVWIPLYLGALYAAVGSFYTAPGALDGGAVEKQWFFHRAIRKPFVINSIALGIPIALVAGVTPCAVLSQNALSNNYEDYQAFSRSIKANIGASVTTISRTEMNMYIDEASRIWNNVAHGKRYLAIGYAVWTAFAAVLLLFYIPAGGYVLALVKRQVNLQRDKINKVEQNNLEILRAQQRQQAMQEQEKHSSNPQEHEERQPEEQGQQALLFQPLLKSITEEKKINAQQQKQPPPAFPRYENSPRGRDSSTIVEGSPPITPTTVVNRSEEYRYQSRGDEEEQQPVTDAGSRGDVFFPPLKPSQQKREHWQLAADAGPVARHKYLRRCFRSLLVLYTGIVAAALIYLVVAARLASHLYTDYFRGPDAATYLVGTSHLPAAWAAAVFGTLTVGAVFFRWFDPAKPTPPTPSPAPQKLLSPRANRLAGVHHSSLHSSDNGQIQSRSLPPVPEGMSQSGYAGDGLHSISIPNAGHHPLDPESSPGRTMKFRLGQDGRKPGALFMMPVNGGELSSAGNVEEQQTQSTRSWRRFGRRSVSRDAYGGGGGVPEDVTQSSSFMTDELRSRPDCNVPEVPEVPSTVHHAAAGTRPRKASLSNRPLAPARSIAAPQSDDKSGDLNSIRPPSWAHPAGQRGVLNLQEGLDSIALPLHEEGQRLGEAFQYTDPGPSYPMEDRPDSNASPLNRHTRSGSLASRTSSNTLYHHHVRKDSLPPGSTAIPRESSLPPIPTSPAFGGARVYGDAPAVVITSPTSSNHAASPRRELSVIQGGHRREASYDFF